MKSLILFAGACLLWLGSADHLHAQHSPLLDKMDDNYPRPQLNVTDITSLKEQAGINIEAPEELGYDIDGFVLEETATYDEATILVTGSPGWMNDQGLVRVFNKEGGSPPAFIGEIAHPEPADDQRFGTAVSFLGLTNYLKDDEEVQVALVAVSGGGSSPFINIVYLNTEALRQNQVQVENTRAIIPGDDARFEFDAQSQFGKSLARIERIGDSVLSFAIGAPLEEDENGNPSGAVFVVFFDLEDEEAVAVQKVDKAFLASQNALGGNSFDEKDEFGYALANLGDLDNDNNVDLGVGAPGTSGANTENQGSIWILCLDLVSGSDPDDPPYAYEIVRESLQLMYPSDDAAGASPRFGSDLAAIGLLNQAENPFVKITPEPTLKLPYVLVGAPGEHQSRGAFWALQLDMLEKNTRRSYRVDGLALDNDEPAQGNLGDAFFWNAAKDNGEHTVFARSANDVQEDVLAMRAADFTNTFALIVSESRTTHPDYPTHKYGFLDAELNPVRMRDTLRFVDFLNRQDFPVDPDDPDSDAITIYSARGLSLLTNVSDLDNVDYIKYGFGLYLDEVGVAKCSQINDCVFERSDHAFPYFMLGDAVEVNTDTELRTVPRPLPHNGNRPGLQGNGINFIEAEIHRTDGTSMHISTDLFVENYWPDVRSFSVFAEVQPPPDDPNKAPVLDHLGRTVTQGNDATNMITIDLEQLGSRKNFNVEAEALGDTKRVEFKVRIQIQAQDQLPNPGEIFDCFKATDYNPPFRLFDEGNTIDLYTRCDPAFENATGLENKGYSLFEVSARPFDSFGKNRKNPAIFVRFTGSLPNAPISANKVSSLVAPTFQAAESTLNVYETDLYQNFPNPFTGGTTFSYALKEGAMVKLSIMDLTGRVLDVVQEGYTNEGVYQVSYSNEMLSSGLYFLRLEVDERTFTKKMVVVK